MVKISPSILSADFSKLGEEISKIEKAGADYIHIDVMDGSFVPNITIGNEVIKSLRPISKLTFDVHLMINNPDHHIKAFAEAGSDIITIHAEATKHLDRSLSLIKSFGKKAGVSLVPSTHEDCLDYVLEKLDLILVMTVNPGFGGQKFLESQLKKIGNIREKIDQLEKQTGKKIDLEVDGGINPETSKMAIQAGANVLVAGSYIFGSSDYSQSISKLRPQNKYVIYGLGISGLATAKFLTKNNEKVIATDDNEKTISDNIKKFPEINFQKADQIKYDEKTIVSFSPGIPIYFPKPHKILEIIKETKTQLACDIEIFYRKNHENNFIGITGTNGKSTTTALTGFIFKELKFPSEIGGNIGVPCFELTQNQKNFSYIFETSSFQLDLLSQTHFKIAALLNITPDHIDRHGSMANYIAAKKRIFRNQTNQDFAIIDVDNENSRQVFEELKNDKNFHATLIAISTKKIQENGIAVFNNKLFNRVNGAKSELDLKSEFLLGEHNNQNMAFAFAITYCHLIQNSLNITEAEIILAIKKFKGLRHRMQFLGEISGIKFINDSKATNAESTANALKAYDNIFWIVGGKPKEGGISSLKPYFKKITKAFLIGEATEEFATVLERNSVDFIKCGDLKNAITQSFLEAKKRGTKENNILLSPACASLDQWKNFEERGDFFCKAFDELQNS